jgi:hypothetical protein
MGNDLADHGGLSREGVVAHVRPRFFAKSMGRAPDKLTVLSPSLEKLEPSATIR